MLKPKATGFRNVNVTYLSCVRVEFLKSKRSDIILDQQSKGVQFGESVLVHCIVVLCSTQRSEVRSSLRQSWKALGVLLKSAQSCL